MASIKITKTFVDRLRLKTERQEFYRDSELQGFGVRVGATAKSYFVEKRVNGRTVRTTIGRHGQITCEQARRRAQEILGEMTGGENPNRKKHEARAASLTLAEVFEDFLRARNSLKTSTIEGYRYTMETTLQDWQARPVRSITGEQVARKHREIGETNGHATANLAMRTLRSVLGFATTPYSGASPIITENPVWILTATKGWYRIGRKQEYIAPESFGAWFQAVDALPGERGTEYAQTVRDFLLLTVFTGLRLNEALRLRWQDIDLRAKTLIVHETKNGTPLTLPLSSFVFDILKRRFGDGCVGYVFPGSGKTGHITKPKRVMQEITKKTCVRFTIHDLRRSFTTTADALDLSAYAVKRLINHSTAGDVTAGYIIHSIDRLRDPMQRITDRLLELAEQDATAEQTGRLPTLAQR